MPLCVCLRELYIHRGIYLGYLLFFLLLYFWIYIRIGARLISGATGINENG